MFSQSGEDGILGEIFRRIGTTERRFVEIGVGNGLENNTAYLLAQGWHGPGSTGSPGPAARRGGTSRRRWPRGELVIQESMVTAENIAPTLDALGARPSSTC